MQISQKKMVASYLFNIIYMFFNLALKKDVGSIPYWVRQKVPIHLGLITTPTASRSPHRWMICRLRAQTKEDWAHPRNAAPVAVPLVFLSLSLSTRLETRESIYRCTSARALNPGKNRLPGFIGVSASVSAICHVAAEVVQKSSRLQNLKYKVASSLVYQYK